MAVLERLNNVTDTNLLGILMERYHLEDTEVYDGILLK
jgi:hypothetical protein